MINIICSNSYRTKTPFEELDEIEAIIENLNFEQSGYSLFYITHHDINSDCKNVETNNRFFERSELI